jgi:hypothetical protein
MLKFDFMNYPLNWQSRDCMLQNRPVVTLATLWIDALFSTDVEVLDLPILGESNTVPCSSDHRHGLHKALYLGGSESK